MGQGFQASALVPRGFVVEAICEGCELLITIRPVTGSSVCPGCGAVPGRIHSRYRRSLTDLPVAGRRVRFGDDVLAPWARRTSRLEHLVHHLALARGAGPPRASPAG